VGSLGSPSRRLLPALGLALVCAALPTPASAATVSAGTAFVYSAAASESNDLTLTSDGSRLTFSDSGAPVTAMSGCSSTGAHTAVCDVPLGSTPSVEIDLGDGDDRAEISGVPGAVVNGGTGHDALSASGPAPVTLNGDGGDDVLHGSHGADTLSGGSGQDLIDGGQGADAMDGGPDVDTLDYSERSAGVTIDLASTDPVQGEAGEGDTAAAFEKAGGGSGDDTLSGGGGPDVLAGGPGDDRLNGRGDADKLIGGPGRDSADYSKRTEALELVIGGGPVSGSAVDGPEGARDTIDSTVEALIAGSGDDRLTGDAGDNILDGGPGADVLSGGPGEDAADYTSRSEPLRLRDDGKPESGGAGDGPAGAQDTIASDVEDLWGGSGADVLTGDAGDNLLNGGPGPDVLTGEGGEDAADYSERSAAVVAAPDGKPDSGNDADGPPGARDTIALDVEDLIGSQGDDQLDGSASRNYIDGEGGNDLIDVRDRGADYADCGDGNDVAWVAPDDLAASDCERIGNGPDTTGGPGGGSDKTRPQVRVSLLGTRQSAASVLAGGLVIHFTCSETCGLDARLLLGRAAARRLGIKLAPRHLLVARTAAGRAGPGQGRFTMRIVPRLARRLRGARNVDLTLEVIGRDAAGNRTTVWRKLHLGPGRLSLQRGRTV